jgi:hypothetical protein
MVERETYYFYCIFSFLVHQRFTPLSVHPNVTIPWGDASGLPTQVGVYCAEISWLALLHSTFVKINTAMGK